MKDLLTYSVVATLGMLSLPALAQDFDLPPDLVVPVEEQGVQSPADTVEEPDAPEGRSRSATLETQFRAFQIDELSGGNTAALRASAHYYGTYALNDRASLLFNLRGRLDREEGQAFSFRDSFNLDVQELAISYTVSPRVTLQFGRINIRNGVAIGFNPTDWFKDNSLVTAESAAPSDRRRERLGVFALTGTASVGNTLLQVGYRPKISASAGSILSDMDNVGLGLDRTNSTNAFFIKATPQFGSNLSVTGNFLLNDGDPGLGFEVSGTIGDNLVLYGEVFAQKRLSIASEALASGLGSAAFQQGLGVSNSKDWEVQAALGLNWALPQSIIGTRDISVALEYHLNTAGLTSSQIDTLASATGADGAAAGAIYGTASRRQEPLARNQIFARMAWNDFWGDSDLSVLGFYVPADDSGLAQVSVDIPVGQNASINFRGISTFGKSTSIYGANPTRRSLQLGMTYVF